MNKCIICHKDHVNETVEHIVPRALGNIHYILSKGLVCNNCNNRFAKYEHVVLNDEEWLKRRKHLRLVKNPELQSGRPPDEDEMAVFLMKILYESIYCSRPGLLKTLNFDKVRKALSKGIRVPSQVLSNKRLQNDKPIPRWFDRWRLHQNHISLSYKLTGDYFWFQFRFLSIFKILKLNMDDFDSSIDISRKGQMT